MFFGAEKTGGMRVGNHQHDNQRCTDWHKYPDGLAAYDTIWLHDKEANDIIDGAIGQVRTHTDPLGRTPPMKDTIDNIFEDLAHGKKWGWVKLSSLIVP